MPFVWFTDRFILNKQNDLKTNFIFDYWHCVSTLDIFVQYKNKSYFKKGVMFILSSEFPTTIERMTFRALVWSGGWKKVWNQRRGIGRGMEIGSLRFHFLRKWDFKKHFFPYKPLGMRKRRGLPNSLSNNSVKTQGIKNEIMKFFGGNISLRSLVS